MTFHHNLAGAESVYAFMLGSPSFFTRADMARGFRGALDMEIERLIALADHLDGDVDREDDGSAEPSLGWCQGNYASRYGSGDDRESEDEHDEADGSVEPSLAFPENHCSAAYGWHYAPVRTFDGDQRRPGRGGYGCANDREQDIGDEREGEDYDKEPNLGWNGEGQGGATGSALHGDDEDSLGATIIQGEQQLGWGRGTFAEDGADA